MKHPRAILDDCCTLFLEPSLSGADYEALRSLVHWYRKGFRENFFECDAPAWVRVKALHVANWPYEAIE